MFVIGLSGAIGHGKTTFANALAREIPATMQLESSMVISEVATRLQGFYPIGLNPNDLVGINTWLKNLPPILKNILGKNVPFEKIKITDLSHQDVSKLLTYLQNLQQQPYLAQQAITEENKREHRPFLQWLGGYLIHHFDAGIWYNELIRRTKKAKENGYELCIVSGLRFPEDARLLSNVQATIVRIYRPGIGKQDHQDITEKEQHKITVDTTIVNNGSIDDLQTCAKTFWVDFQRDQLKEQYYALPTMT